MKKLERLKSKLEKAVAERAGLIRGGKLIEAGRATSRITALERAIEDARRYEPQQLGKLLPAETLRSSGLSKKLIEVHLAADYLADCAFDVRETLESLGFADCSIFPMLKAIQDRAQEFANIVCHPDFAGLSDFMTTNERFIDDMHLISRRYIADKLLITD